MNHTFEFLTVTVAIINALLIVVALFVVPSNRRPSSGMAWLLFIFLAPIIGFIAFLILGGRYLPRRRRNRHYEVKKALQKYVARWVRKSAPSVPRVPDERLASAIALGRNLGAFPMMGGNTFSLHSLYNETFVEMARAIDGAKKFVHMEFYILVRDKATEPVFAALARAKKRGVEVRVLLDYISTVRNPWRRRTQKTLEDMGALFRYALPVRPWRGEYQRPDLRNHRKILVIDGTRGFMGSQNLIDAHYNKHANRRRGLSWKDLTVQVSGSAAACLDAVFATDWHAETGELLQHTLAIDPPVAASGGTAMQLIPSGPGYVNENNLQVFVALIYAAKRRVWITSPYFIPERALMIALKAATARGVEVTIFVSEVGDQPVTYYAQRSYYEELLLAGVRIFMYRPPYILHAKHFTVDDDVAVIGSSNMDSRSFNLNYEVSMLVQSADFVRELDRVNATTIAHSRELTLREWQSRSVFVRLVNNLARLTSALQ
ncbi:cardiolipin synthase [Canibacter sp. lx-45]|uniref:cardiolipin synthase n=1 Tax=Canibacter zhuwentaonis TaxID=2837491 RepID=UPI001BDC10FD|nr:cardiolipin synthase [Canibacter zhuwentaonis]MBT1035546.1 cardiolipin synthase [Canibacter zhuwentaonis]